MDVSDPNGANWVGTVQAIFNWSTEGPGSCTVMYSQVGNVLFLEDDAADGWLGDAAPGTANSNVSNSQCTLAISGAGVTQSGNDLILSLPITFASSFIGPQHMFSIGQDHWGLSSDDANNESFGTYTAVAAQAQAPTVTLTHTPDGANSTTFTLTASDVNGSSYIAKADLLLEGIGTSNGSVTECRVSYDRALNQFTLEPEGGTDTAVTWTPGTAVTAVRGNCQIDTVHTVAGGAPPNGLTLTVPVTAGSGAPASVAAATDVMDHTAVELGATIRDTWNLQAFSSVTVTTLPAGLAVTVDGVTCAAAPCTYNWTTGSPHTLAGSTQAGGTGTRYVIAAWSDGTQGATDSITAATGTVTAIFGTQYLLTTSAGAGGAVMPAGSNWYDAGQPVAVSAIPNAGYMLTGFGGGLTGNTTPQYVNMTGPLNVSASFALAPDFTMGITPAATAMAGGQAQFTVTVAGAKGFNGTVALAAAGLPAGASASFNPAAITGSGTCTMTVTAPAGGAGSFTVTANGSSGTLSHNAAGVLSVQDFTITMSPNVQAMTTTTSATFTIAVAGINGFAGPITVSLNVAGSSFPPLSNIIWNPATMTITPGGAPATVTFVGQSGSVPPTTPLAYPFSVHGSGGGIGHNAFGQINLTPQTDFTATLTAASETVTAPGTSASFGLTLLPVNTFAGTVNVSVAGLPAGLTANYNPAVGLSPSAGTVTDNVTVTAVAGMPPGTYPFTITCMGPDTTRTMYAFAMVGTGGQGYTVAVSPSPQTVAPGGTATYTVQVVGSGGFGGTVSLSVSGGPAGAAVSVNPAAIAAGGTATLTVATATVTPLGNYSVTVAGVSNGVMQRAGASVTVAAAAAESIVTPVPGTTIPGGQTAFTWNQGNGASGYTLSVGSAPGGTNYYSATGTALGASVSVPSSGTIYVTLTSFTAVGPLQESYTYVVGSGASQTPQVVSGVVPAVISTGQPGLPVTLQFTPDVTTLTGCAQQPDMATQLISVDGASNTATFRFTGARSARPGPRGVTCSTSSGGTVSLELQEWDPTPVIASITSDPYPLIVGQEGEVIISGAYFGPNWGSVSICSPSGKCQGYPTPPWHEDDIEVPLTPLEAGSYGVTVCSLNWLGLGLEPAPGEPNCTEGSVEVTDTEEPVTVAMRLEQVGDPVISSDGKYSEDTTIRITAIDASTGETLTNWTGTVNIAEKGTAIYSQNGGNVPSSANIASDGTATFIAKSLAGPRFDPDGTGHAPDAAQLTTTNYPLIGGSLAVPQWIISGLQLDGHASGQVYDWVQARSRDLFASATGDLKTVLAAVSSYTMGLIPDAAGRTDWQRAAQSPIVINPYILAMRLDQADPGKCGAGLARYFVGTFLHEARHAFQAAQAAIPGNDGDGDFLVNSISISPSQIFLDTTDLRSVCNESTPEGTVLRLAYHGDRVLDTSDAPDFASYAWEMDAWTFASTWTKAQQ